MISGDAAPRTPPRRRDRDRDEGDDDRQDERQGSDDDESHEEAVKKKICRGRRSWTQLGSWDRTALLDSEIDHQILTLANERME